MELEPSAPQCRGKKVLWARSPEKIRISGKQRVIFKYVTNTAWDMLILEHDAAAESAPCRVTKGQEATSPAFCRGLQELAEAGAADPRARVLWRWLRVLRQPPRLMGVRSRREGPLPGALPVTMANEAMATLRPARSLPRKRPSPTRQESSIPPRSREGATLCQRPRRAPWPARSNLQLFS